MKRRLMGYLITGLVMYAALLVVVYLAQRRLQYFPSREDPRLPSANAYPGLIDVDLVASDGVKLRAWYWPGSKRATFLIFHGNAGHRGHRLPWAATLRDLGPGVFLFDYRGYGGSGGSPTEAGLLKDGEAARAWLAENAPGPVVYVGESIGCSVAVGLAAREAPAGLVLHNGTISVVDVAATHYPFVPVKWLMRDRFDHSELASTVKVPALCLHGAKDSIIPIRFGRRLHAALGGPKVWIEIPNAGHNDLLDEAANTYFQGVAAFLKSHLD
ncbi:MAG: alpha/beta hydrolase [Planctomycetota bacterium]